MFSSIIQEHNYAMVMSLHYHNVTVVAYYGNVITLWQHV